MTSVYTIGKFGWPMLGGKFVSSFSSEVKSIVSSETDKYLAKASLIDIGAFVPNIDTERNIDLLPVAFNAFVANRVNKNDDVIDSASAISCHKLFINKPINVEHDRGDIVGVILSASFSEFGTDKPLTEEEVSKMTAPFNVVLGGVIWKMADKNIATKIEDSSDPQSLRFGDISASWELGFVDHEIVKITGSSKNLEDGVIISDAKEVENLTKLLKCSNGSGSDGEVRFYRKPIGHIVPFGIGLTAAPAAEVKGIATPKTVEVSTKATEEITEDVKNVAISENIISQIKNTDVSKANETVYSMKITNLNEITDESMKTLQASTVREFVTESIKEASEKFCADKEKADKAIELAKAQSEEVTKQMDIASKQLSELQVELKKLQDEKASMKKVEDFNKRMASLDSKYELSAEISKVIANQIKTLDTEEAFSAWTESMTVFLKPFDKAAKASVTEVVEAKASEAVVEAALDAAKSAAGSVTIPNASAGEKSKDKWSSALKEEDIEFK